MRLAGNAHLLVGKIRDEAKDSKGILDVSDIAIRLMGPSSLQYGPSSQRRDVVVIGSTLHLQPELVDDDVPLAVARGLVAWWLRQNGLASDPHVADLAARLLTEPAGSGMFARTVA
jgi:hypothetical protein